MSTLFWRGCIFWLHVNPVLKGLYLLITCQPCSEGVVSSDYMSNLFWWGCIFWLDVNLVLKGLYLLITCQPYSEGVVSSDYMSNLLWRGCIFWLHVNPGLKGLYLLITCQPCSEGVASFAFRFFQMYFRPINRVIIFPYFLNHPILKWHEQITISQKLLIHVFTNIIIFHH